MNLTHHLKQLQHGYRAAFNAEFDPQAFTADRFYASQVLEKALRNGPHHLWRLAAPLEAMLLHSLNIGEAPGARASAAWLAIEATTIPGLHPPPAARPRNSRHGAGERRGLYLAGHARMGDREIFMLSKLRLQYRRAFGMFFDILEFTANDLYARTLLTVCAQSGDGALRELAGEFLNQDGTPRFHRRAGRADLELAGAARSGNARPAPRKAGARRPSRSAGFASQLHSLFHSIFPARAMSAPSHARTTVLYDLMENSLQQRHHGSAH
ncbi:MAG TPA: hypothetical protein VH105_03215 [Burkholderiales bacterium]|nr:hypothetical protein [Burkholderiales bacterium]